MLQPIIVGASTALLIHFSANRCTNHTVDDYIIEAIILINAIVFLFCVQLLQIITVSACIWNRNRKAAIIAKKVNAMKQLTPEEKCELNELIDEGVLKELPYVYGNRWCKHIVLSNNDDKEEVFL